MPNRDQGASLVWLRRGETPRESQFRPHGASSQSYHADIHDAVNEAMRVLSSGLADGRQPWILSHGTLLDPDDIQLAHGRSSPHLTAMAHY